MGGAGTDPGALALALWAAAELPAGEVAGSLATSRHAALRQMLTTLDSNVPVPTVDLAWSLTALLAAARQAQAWSAWGGEEAFPAESVRAAQTDVVHRLLTVQGVRGLFPHFVPADSINRMRSHVGCFADQVYPIQALARYSAASGDRRALDAAALCAERIVQLQGGGGQWWWHYDSRTGDVVEGYPVYSVHQHAMAPMALFDLREAGGPDLRQGIVSGLRWLLDPPEMPARLVDEQLDVVWRKIGRREPSKLVRRVRSVTTAIRPGFRLSSLDGLFPPSVVDKECRPYELGWLLYAWRSGGVVDALRESAEENRSIRP